MWIMEFVTQAVEGTADGDDKAGTYKRVSVTICDGCDGILGISYGIENIVTIVTTVTEGD